MQERYGEEVARFICELTGWPEVFEFRDGGVFVKKEYLDHDPGQDALTWTPACDMNWPGAPDPMTAPSMPTRPMASEVAAFMLYGPGGGIQDQLGCIVKGPYEKGLAEIIKLDVRATEVLKVIREAYDLARQAQNVVGKPNLRGQKRARDLLSQYDEAFAQAMEREKVRERVVIGKNEDGSLEYGDPLPSDEYLSRLAHAKKAVAAQWNKAQRANARVEASQVTWRKSMVRELLRPEESCGPAPLSSDAQTQATTLNPAPTQNTAMPAPAGAVILYSTKTRRNTLQPVIELAQANCLNPQDAAEVWANLLVLAEKKHPPLLGATEDGLQYLKGGNAANLTHDALVKRLNRQTPLTAASRR